MKEVEKYFEDFEIGETRTTTNQKGEAVCYAEHVLYVEKKP